MERKRSRKIVLHVVSWAISIALMAGLLYLVDLEELAQRMGQDDWAWALVGLVLVGVGLVVKGVRWWVIVGLTGPARMRTCIRLSIAAMLLNSFIPLRGGDVARGLLLARESHLTKSQALGTVGLDKLFDVMVIALLVLPLPFMGGIPEWVGWPAVASVTIGFVLLFTGVMLRYGLRRRGQSPRKAGWVVRTLKDLTECFDCIRRPWPAVQCALLSVLSITLLLGAVTTSFMAVGLTPGITRSIVTLLAVQISASIPLTPASTGTMHGAIVAALAGLGHDAEAAMSVAIVFHAVQTLPIIVMGLFASRRTAYRGLSTIPDPPDEDAPDAPDDDPGPI